MKYYERIIKKEVIMTLYCTDKKLRRGEKKNWLFVLGPDTLS